MAQLTPVSFSSPGYDYTAELMEIDRRKALANAMQQQSMEPIQQQQGGRFAVPINPLQGAAKLAQAYVGALGNRRAQEGATELAKKSQADYAAMVNKGLGQLQGVPATEDTAGNYIAAQQPDPAAAMATFGSHPMGQALMPMALQEMQRQRLAAALRAQAGGGTPGGQGGGMGGDAFGVPMEAWLQADPSGKLYFEQLAKARAPINVRPGGTVYTPGMGPQYTAPQNGIQTLQGPQGPVSGPVPGYLPTAAQNAAALAMAQSGGQAAGKLPYQTQVVQTAPEPRLMTGAQAVQAATGAPPPAPFGLGGGQPQAPMGAPQGQGGIPGLRLQDQGAAAEQREFGKGLGEYASKVQGDAANAAVANRYLDNMQLAARDFTPGKLAPMQSNLTQWAQSIGIPVSEADKKSAGSIQALTSMAIKMAGTATRQSDAQPSQLQYFKILESMPNEARTVDGFNKIVAYMRDANNYSVAKHQNLQAWRQAHNGSAEGFEAQWPRISAQLPFVWNQMKQTQDLKAIAATAPKARRATSWKDLP